MPTKPKPAKSKGAPGSLKSKSSVATEMLASSKADKAIPTKPKPAKSTGAPGSLESKLNGAIEILAANKASEAIPLFEAIAKEATESGNFSMARAAKSYIANKQHKKAAPMDADPIQEAVFLLNSKQPETALEKIEKILKTQSSSAQLHYLKALALAGTQQVELSAQCLKKAIDMDSGLLFIYKLEPDFKPCRNSPSFAEFETS
jgi:tetratricopeptide (TPR) repeat protein